MVDPETGETPEEQELAKATQPFLDALAAVNCQTQEDEPGLVTAENYNPPNDGDGSGASDDEGARETAPRLNAFGSDSARW